MQKLMFSSAGKIHEKCNRVSPLPKKQRQKLYASNQVSPRRSPEKKQVSPFDTPSRDSRDSYLLRVTKQPNIQSNYEPNYHLVQIKQRRSTIDKASFERMIGQVGEKDFSLDRISKLGTDRRCSASFSNGHGPKPLTIRDAQKWRKTHEHLNFSKQINPETVPNYTKDMKLKNDSTGLKQLKDTRESNFNNFQRFSMGPRSHRAHDFNSDSRHQYLQQVFQRDIEPEYDILASHEEQIKKAMQKPKGQLRFNLFRNEIKTRVDRADPHWLQTLYYSIQNRQKKPSINFQTMETRLSNEIHMKYPMRQSLIHQVPNNKVY